MKEIAPNRNQPARTIEELLPAAFEKLGLKWPEDDNKGQQMPPYERHEYTQEVMRYGL